MENGLLLICKRKEKQEWEALLNLSFLLSVYFFGIYIIARDFRSYSRGRMWAEPTKGNNHDALLVMQKNGKWSWIIHDFALNNIGLRIFWLLLYKKSQIYTNFFWLFLSSNFINYQLFDILPTAEAGAFARGIVKCQNFIFNRKFIQKLYLTCIW